MNEPIKALRVLVVDPDHGTAETLSRLLSEAGIQVAVADSHREAKKLRSRQAFDLLVVDVDVIDEKGNALWRQGAVYAGDMTAVIVTLSPDARGTQEAVSEGVLDCLVKPIEPSESLIAHLRRAMETLELRRANVELIHALEQKSKLLDELAVRDPLTRLFNHSFFQECLEREIIRSRRHGLGFSLILGDVDHFNELNEKYGHTQGNRVLRHLSELVRESSRRSDLGFQLDPQDVVARYSNDVFALILPETPKSGGFAKAENLRQLTASLQQQGLPPVTLSVGVSSFPEDAEDRSQLIRAAEIALKAAKRGGRDRSISFSANLHEAARAKEEDEEISRLIALDRSITGQSFNYVYQPIVKSKDQSVFAFEALCRPQDPVFSNPLELIASARRAGRMSELGSILRKGAIDALPRLPDRILMFLNIDPIELNDPALLDGEGEILGHSGRLVLEITESSAIRDLKASRELLARLKERGFRIALDDLGSGYAGLNSLAALEPDFVKLDMGLVRGIHSDSRSARLIRHIVEFARDENMQVVCEGIETQEERLVVEELGCDLMQGYLFGHPAPPFARLERALPMTGG